MDEGISQLRKRHVVGLGFPNSVPWLTHLYATKSVSRLSADFGGSVTRITRHEEGFAIPHHPRPIRGRCPEFEIFAITGNFPCNATYQQNQVNVLIWEAFIEVTIDHGKSGRGNTGGDDFGAPLGILNAHQAEKPGTRPGTSNGRRRRNSCRCMERKRYLTPYQSNKLVKGDKDGYFMGGYRILYKVASGSFGRVYRADDPSTGRIVAIKVLRKRWSEDKHKVELFMREGKMGQSLVHPNIVEILAISQDKKTGEYYLVMEFVEGGTLRDFLNIRKKLPPGEVLRILEDMAAGLTAAFAKGVTHRDMKLTNVLLSSQGPGRSWSDFGLAGSHGRPAQTARTRTTSASIAPSITPGLSAPPTLRTAIHAATNSSSAAWRMNC